MGLDHYYRRHVALDMPRTGNAAACVDESAFRARVREILNVPWDTRDEALFTELHRLKSLDTPKE